MNLRFLTPVFTPNGLRLVIAVILLSYSIPKLYKIFVEPIKETEKPVMLRAHTDCFAKFNFSSQIDIDSFGDASVILRLEPSSRDGMIPEDCKNLYVNIPGTISGIQSVNKGDSPNFYFPYNLLKGREANLLVMPKGAAVVDLEALADLMSESEFYGLGELHINVFGKIPRFLAPKTFTTRILDLDISGGPSGRINVEHQKTLQPWHYDVSLNLDPAYEIKSSSIKEIDFTNAGLNIHFSSEKPISGTFIFEHTGNARTKDITIVVDGTLFGIGVTLLVDFLGNVPGLIARQRETRTSKGEVTPDQATAKGACVMRNVGYKRTMIARIGAALGFACGVLGLLAALTNHTWKLGPGGWFTGGILITLIAMFSLLDGMFSFQRERAARL